MAARVFLPDKGELEALARRMYRAMEADGCRRVCLGDMGEADFVAGGAGFFRARTTAASWAICC